MKELKATHRRSKEELKAAIAEEGRRPAEASRLQKEAEAGLCRVQEETKAILAESGRRKEDRLRLRAEEKKLEQMERPAAEPVETVEAVKPAPAPSCPAIKGDYRPPIGRRPLPSAHPRKLNLLQRCKLCSKNEVQLAATSNEFRENLVLFGHLLRWTPEPLPIICPSCWESKTPEMASKMATNQSVKNKMGKPQGFVCMTYINTDKDIVKLQAELLRRGLTEAKKSEEMFFRRGDPTNWWRTFSFAHVVPLCIPFGRFVQFCRYLRALSPSLTNHTWRPPQNESDQKMSDDKSVKRDVLTGKHGKLSWTAPNGRAVKKNFSESDWNIATGQWERILKEASPGHVLAVELRSEASYPFTFNIATDTGARKRSRGADRPSSTLIKHFDTHKPCYFSMENASQRLCTTTTTNSGCRFNIIHREVVHGIEYRAVPDQRNSPVVFDPKSGVLNDDAVGQCFSVAKSTKKRSLSLQETQDNPKVKRKKQNQKQRQRQRAARRKETLHDVSDGVLKALDQMGSLLSFNLWSGGVLPLSEPCSAACYHGIISGQGSSPNPAIPLHPGDCVCHLREHVLVGGFHVVQPRQPYFMEHASGRERVLVAGFHAVQSIGPQIAVASVNDHPIAISNVGLAVEYTTYLQKFGIPARGDFTDPSDTLDAFNVPLMLFYLWKSGLPISVLGSTVHHILQQRLAELSQWKQAYTEVPAERKGELDVVDFTKFEAVSNEALDHVRGGIYRAVPCAKCCRLAFLGFVKRAGEKTCFRCAHAYFVQRITPKAMLVIPRVHGKLSDRDVEAFGDVGALVILKDPDPDACLKDLESFCNSLVQTLLGDQLIVMRKPAANMMTKCCVLQNPWNGSLVNLKPDILAVRCMSEKIQIGIKPGSHKQFPALASMYRQCCKPKNIKFPSESHDWCQGTIRYELHQGETLLIDSRCVVRFDLVDKQQKYEQALFSTRRAPTQRSHPHPHLLASLEGMQVPENFDFQDLKQVQKAGVFESPTPSVQIKAGPWHVNPYQLGRLLGGGLHYIVCFFKRPEKQVQTIEKSLPLRKKLSIDEKRDKIYQIYNEKLSNALENAANVVEPPEDQGGLEAWEETLFESMQSHFEAQLLSLTSQSVVKSTQAPRLTGKAPNVVRPLFVSHACQLSKPPESFVPTCVPKGACVCKTILLMSKSFEDNLVGAGPPKTQTLRIWTVGYAAQHEKAFKNGHWVRVWRGQGHEYTIGWALYTSFKTVRLGDLDQEGCVREGRPHDLPGVFLKTFLLRGEIPAKAARVSKTGRFYAAKKKKPPVTLDSTAYEIRFVFHPCVQ